MIYSTNTVSISDPDSSLSPLWKGFELIQTREQVTDPRSNIVADFAIINRELNGLIKQYRFYCKHFIKPDTDMDMVVKMGIGTITDTDTASKVLNTNYYRYAPDIKCNLSMLSIELTHFYHKNDYIYAYETNSNSVVKMNFEGIIERIFKCGKRRDCFRLMQVIGTEIYCWKSGLKSAIVLNLELEQLGTVTFDLTKMFDNANSFSFSVLGKNKYMCTENIKDDNGKKSCVIMIFDEINIRRRIVQLKYDNGETYALKRFDDIHVLNSDFIVVVNGDNDDLMVVNVNSGQIVQHRSGETFSGFRMVSDNALNIFKRGIVECCTVSNTDVLMSENVVGQESTILSDHVVIKDEDGDGDEGFTFLELLSFALEVSESL